MTLNKLSMQEEPWCISLKCSAELQNGVYELNYASVSLLLCMYIHVQVCIFMCTCVYPCVPVCSCVHMCIHACIHGHVCVHSCVHGYIYVNICVYSCACRCDCKCVLFMSMWRTELDGIHQEISILAFETRSLSVQTAWASRHKESLICLNSA